MAPKKGKKKGSPGSTAVEDEPTATTALVRQASRTGSTTKRSAPLPDPILASAQLDAYVNDLGAAEYTTLDADDRAIPDLVAMTIPELLRNWDGKDGYGERLETMINLLRDDKLKLYAGETMIAKNDVDRSQARVNVWRQVFEERYGLSGDPQVSSEPFLSHGIEKLIPDDIDNINRYMRFRTLFLILYNEAVKRKAKTLKDITPDIRISSTKYISLADAVDALTPSETKTKRKGGHSNNILPPPPSSILWLRRLNWLKNVHRHQSLLRVNNAARVGGAKRKLKAEDPAIQKELSKWQTLAKLRPNLCADAKGKATDLQCCQGELDLMVRDFQQQLDRVDELEKDLDAIQDRRKALEGVQPWLTADWTNLEELPTAAASVDNLRKILLNSQSTMVGRDDIMNRLASIIHTFSFNHRSFTQTYLNYALLGMPGTGKTTTAQMIADIFRNLGILVTSKFTTIGREDMVGQYLGETALKTKSLLINHIEGVLFLDEAYQLGVRDSQGNHDIYGQEALGTLTNFTDKWRGQFAFIAAGYEENMNDDFFHVNPGLERRFTRLPLDKFSPQQLLKIFFQKLLKKIQDPEDRRILNDPRVWKYALGAFSVLNEKCIGTKRVVDCMFPNQGGDIETLADIAVQYFYGVVKPKPFPIFTPCDMRNIIQRFLFQTQRANVAVNAPDTKDCPEAKSAVTGSKTCDPSGKGCLRLLNPNTDLIAALKIRNLESASNSPSGVTETRRATASSSRGSKGNMLPPMGRPPSRKGGGVPIYYPPFRFWRPILRPLPFIRC